MKGNVKLFFDIGGYGFCDAIARREAAPSTRHRPETTGEVATCCDSHDLSDGCSADMELQTHGEPCCPAEDDFCDNSGGLSESDYNHPRRFPESKGGIWPMKYEWDKMTPLEEVYAIRKRIAEKFGYSLDAIFDAGIKEQREAEARGEKLQFARLPIAQPCFA